MPTSSIETIIVTGKSEVQRLTDQLIELVPPSWTSVEAKRRGGVFWTLMTAIATIFSLVKIVIGQVKAQFRLATATGVYLDAYAQDYFGTGTERALPRQINETDDAYRGRIRAEILRQKATKPGIRRAVSEVTGASPIIVEDIDINTAASWTGYSLDGRSAVAPFTANALPLPFHFGYGSGTIKQFQNTDGTAPADPIAFPTTLTLVDNLHFRWKSTDIVGLNDTDPISSWPGFPSALIASGSQRPAYRTNLIGTLPGVRFDNVDDFMFAQVAAVTVATSWTIYIVLQPTGNFPGFNSRRQYLRTANLSLAAERYSIGLVDYNVDIGTVIHTNVYPVRRKPVIITMSSSSPSGHTLVHVNGVPCGYNYNSIPYIANLYLGKVSEHPSDADYFEIIGYKKQHTPEESAQVHAYLAFQWGISELYTVSPNPGIGSFGGRQFGSPYHFYVFALNNPRAASASSVLKTVQRAKPVGTVEHVFVAK